MRTSILSRKLTTLAAGGGGHARRPDDCICGSAGSSMTTTRNAAPRHLSNSVRIGVCGFCLPQSELFRRFKLLEVQQTFYWPPQLKTVERWRRTAPEDFEFTLKAFQAITHTHNYRTYRKARFS